MRTRGYACSIEGRERPHNEDAFLVDDELGLYVVCDGLGGHRAGEVASHLAVRTVQRALAPHAETLASLGRQPPRSVLQGMVRDAVLLACQAVHTRAQDDPHCAGMGTTLTLLLAAGRFAAVAHVGDSRLYLHRAGRVYLLSDDHSLVNELLQCGSLDEDDAESFEYGHLLTRVVGLQPSVNVDSLVLELLPGDSFLLCSDGLCNSFPQREELGRLLGDPLVEKVPRRLVELADARDGSDNITALVVRVDDGASAEDLGWKGEVELRLETLSELYLFEHLNLRELSRVLQAAGVEMVAAGTTLIVEGSESDALYIVLEGELEVRKAGKHITTLGVGSHVGEMALLNNKPRTATVRATRDARVIVLGQEAFYRLLKSEPGLGLKLLWSVAQELSQRLDWMTERRGGSYETHTHRMLPPPF